MSINDSMKLRSIFSRFSASAKYRVQSSEFTHRKNHGYVGEIKAVRFFFINFLKIDPVANISLAVVVGFLA